MCAMALHEVKLCLLGVSVEVDSVPEAVYQILITLC